MGKAEEAGSRIVNIASNDSVVFVEAVDTVVRGGKESDGPLSTTA